MANCSSRKKRFDNLAYAQENVQKCGKRVRVHDYMPGQVIYHMGDYPAPVSPEPTEYDYNLIKYLSEAGTQIIQLHEDWNDSQRILGADKFSSPNPVGLRNFIDLCHRFNIKVLPYISTGFFDERDPDFIPEFDRHGINLNQEYYRYRMCSLRSPQWCEYVYGKVKSILDKYDFDGLYNDAGPDEIAFIGQKFQKEGRTADPERDIPYNPYEADMLAQLYSMVKQRGGIMKLHYCGNMKPKVKDKVYDYLWVGEAVSNMDDLLKTALYEPYIVPCPDMQYTDESSIKKIFCQSIPFLQFPLRPDGRPMDVIKMLSVSGIEYQESPNLNYFRKMAEYAKEHPDGPYMYSEWSAIPESQLYRDLWIKYLKIYRKMTEENTVCQMNITENTIVKERLPEKVFMSLFSGDEQYLCLSNLSDSTVGLTLSEEWKDWESRVRLRNVKLAPASIAILQRTGVQIPAD